jgi:two-component sensor histidine kinase
MAKRTVATDIEQTEKDTRIIDGLVHEIQNNLQAIMMEAELQPMEERSKREPKCAFDAAQNIERLLGEVRQYFLLRR